MPGSDPSSGGYAIEFARILPLAGWTWREVADRLRQVETELAEKESRKNGLKLRGAREGSFALVKLDDEIALLREKRRRAVVAHALVSDGAFHAAAIRLRDTWNAACLRQPRLSPHRFDAFLASDALGSADLRVAWKHVRDLAGPIVQDALARLDGEPIRLHR